jgi:hypothetical protein
MQRISKVAVLSLALALVGVRAYAAGGDAKPAAKPAAPDDTLDEHTRLGAPISYKNLTLVPIFARDPGKDAANYLTLDEAFDANLVRVRELSDESVNQLSLENKSDRPLFVMSGEVILGGKQDRIIGKDRLIPPRKTLSVDVFCVEHGRWTEDAKDKRAFRSAKVMAHTSLRNKAAYDTQSDVWQEVATKNAKRSTENDTGTYRAVTADKAVAKSVREYADYFAPALAKLADKDRLVGFVVVMNGQLVGVEAFGSPRLFASLRDKLLRSYFTEAMDLPAPADAAALAKVPSPKDVRDFVAKPAAAEEQVIVNDAKGKTRQKKGAGVAATEVDDESAPAAAAPVFRSTSAH